MELFKDLERPVLAKLFLGLTPQNFAAGDSVMEQGQAERSLFILLAGTIEIDNDHIPHNPETLLEVGASFGELQFLSLRPTSVLDLTTKTPCKLWTISRKDFLDVMDDTDDTVSRIVSAAVTVYQNYVGLFEEQGVEAVVESRRTRYIAEVARYDVIDNERRILFERLHADAGTDTGTGTGTGAPEVEYNPTAGGDSMRSGMWLNGSSLGDNPPRSRRGTLCFSLLALHVTAVHVTAVSIKTTASSSSSSSSSPPPWLFCFCMHRFCESEYPQFDGQHSEFGELRFRWWS